MKGCGVTADHSMLAPARDREWMSVSRIATAVAVGACGLLSLLALPLVFVSTGGLGAATMAALVSACTVAPLCALTVIWLTDALDERRWRNPASRHG